MVTKIARHPEAFSLSVGNMRRPRVKDEGHLAFIRRLPCLKCKMAGMTEATHVRYGSIIHGKRETGKAEKPSDKWTVPLCVDHHREQHAAGNERGWWLNQGRDPLKIAALLYCASVDDDDEAGRAIVLNN